MGRLTATEFQQAGGVEDWRVLSGGASAWFDASSHTAGSALVGRIVELTDGASLPAMDLRAGGVRVQLGAAGPADLSHTDATLARAVSAAAADLGLTADPAALQTVSFGFDAADTSSVMSFWKTALDYQPGGADVLTDPLRRGPEIFFRGLDDPRPLRNRIHLDVVRVPEVVQSVLAVVGSQPYGAYGLTLVDAEGNEVDVVPGEDLAEGPATADWRVVFSAMAFYPTASAAQAARLAAIVAALADEVGTPLLVDVRPDGVTIDSGKDQSDDELNPSQTPFTQLATRIQAAAHELGLAADTTRLRFIQVGIDAVDVAAVQAFWATGLGYQHDQRTHVTDIYDPRRLNPEIIFQDLDAAEQDRRRQRNRIHLNLQVPDDHGKARIAAAVAAGGRVLTDVPGRCTLADPEGNELNIVTNA